MDYLEKIKAFASNAAELIGQKSKEAYGVAKVKLAITEKQNKVKELYKQIGFDAYKAYRSETDIVQQISPLFKDVDALEEEIALLKQKAEDIKTSSDADIEIIEADAELDKEQAEYDEADKEPVDFE